MSEPHGFDLAGKTVLVTGAAKRIGRSIALRLHQEGARVLIHYSTSRAEAEMTAAECGGAGLFSANLEHVDQIQRMFAEIAQREGRLDGLVNNAARFTRIDPLQVTRGRLGLRSFGQFEGQLLCRPAGRAADAAQSRGSGPHREHQLDGGFSGLGREHPLLCVESRGDRADTLPGQGSGAWHHRQFRRAGSDPVRRGERGKHPAHGALDARGAAGHGRGDCPRRSLYFLKASNFVTGQTLQVDGGLGLR